MVGRLPISRLTGLRTTLSDRIKEHLCKWFFPEDVVTAYTIRQDLRRISAKQAELERIIYELEGRPNRHPRDGQPN